MFAILRKKIANFLGKNREIFEKKKSRIFKKKNREFLRKSRKIISTFSKTFCYFFFRQIEVTKVKRQKTLSFSRLFSTK